jgi:RNA polymerase sigma-70 factor (ECF subfamily)
MTRAEEFEELRPLLFAIASRIPGSVSEAEDAVQETWLRLEASPTHGPTYSSRRRRADRSTSIEIGSPRPRGRPWSTWVWFPSRS